MQRSKVFKQPEDAIHAAKYLRHLRGQPQADGSLGVSRHAITTSLIDVLAYHVQLGIGNVMEHIEEMGVLCRELLSSDMAGVDTTQPIIFFAKVVSSKIRSWIPDQVLDQIIECLRAVRKYKPDLHEARFALARSLACRYSMTLLDDDYEEAASMMDEIIDSSSSGDSDDKLVALVQMTVTTLATTRSATHENPEYLEEAMYRTRAFFNSYPTGHPFNPFVDHSLEDTAEKRFRYFGSIEGLEASSSSSPLSPRGMYEDDISELSLTKKTEWLEEIRSGIRDNDITKIDEAVEISRTILGSCAPGDPDETLRFLYFGTILFEAFDHSDNIEYLNESISTLRGVLERPEAHYLRHITLCQLAVSLITRFVCLLDRLDDPTEDLDEALELLSLCVNDRHASFPHRFQYASLCATFARITRHPSTSTAYKNAISSMRKALLFAPTLHLQHVSLARSEYSHKIPLDYASYLVDLGQLDEAIETLEGGRALLWSEMRYLRTSVDKLLEADPDLGQKFASVNWDLEDLTKSTPPSHKLSTDDDIADGLRAVDPFGRLLLKQRMLLKERDILIAQIQTLPGFDSFLKPLSFDTLRSAASSGPVIIVNHSQWRSDILILLHNTPPSLIPTPHDFYNEANALNDKLLDSRLQCGLDSSHYNETLASVLADLYKLVGKPVIDRLRQLHVPEQSRIWWCPTSVFCSLPLHAMGPIPSDDGEIRYFLDLFICSYTPTLSALIQSRNRDFGSRSSNRPSLLLVAQPDPSLPTVGGEIQAVQSLDTVVTSLISEAATPAAVIDGFRHHQFVHFACHGTLEDGKPFEAGFELYEGERLTLLEIVRAHLPTAEFAFLSACHTAEVTEGSAADEGLHLAAAVQYCGFRSVVGTMWAMVDEDGQDLAKHFYKALFSASRQEGIPYHERSAEALRFAVKKLRRKRRITLERWVNFVHYGA